MIQNRVHKNFCGTIPLKGEEKVARVSQRARGLKTSIFFAMPHTFKISVMGMTFPLKMYHLKMSTVE
jgi:hypothetical protein